jgi:hypothetical protein
VLFGCDIYFKLFVCTLAYCDPYCLCKTFFTVSTCLFRLARHIPKIPVVACFTKHETVSLVTTSASQYRSIHSMLCLASFLHRTFDDVFAVKHTKLLCPSLPIALCICNSATHLLMLISDLIQTHLEEILRP